MRLQTFVPSLTEADMPCNTIVTDMGMEFFQTLQTHFGGRELKLPKTPGHMADSHRLVQAVGRQDAERLATLMRGEVFYVPRGYRSFQRLTEVQDALKTGIGTQDMATRLGVSARQIRRIKQQLRDIAARSNRIRPAVMAAE